MTKKTPELVGLSFSQGDETWHKLRRRCLDDLFFFNSSVLGYADLFPLEDTTHLIMHKFIERQTGVPDIDEAPVQLLLQPRETGKSSTATIGHAIQMACGNPNIAILIANESADLAQDFLKTIKQHFESNQFLRALFPEVVPADFNKTEWSATRATLQRNTRRPEATFSAIGVGGNVVGHHFDRILTDDLISRKAAEGAKAGSWTLMESANFWVTTLRPLLSIGARPFPWVRFCGTRWYPGDSYEFIERTFSHGEKPRRYRIKARCADGTVVSRVVTRCGDLATMTVSGIENGVAVFPKIWSLDRCSDYRFENAELFAANVLNDPVASDVRVFQDPWLRYWELANPDTIHYVADDGSHRYVLLANLHKILVVDPAFSASKDSDRSALVVLGSDYETGKRLVLDAQAEKVEPADLVEDVLNAAKRWRVSTVYIESVAQQLGFIQFAQTAARAQNAHFGIEVVKPGGRNKDLRIEAISSYFKNGKVLVHRSQLDLLAEYGRYRPGAKYYRDLLDALAYAIEKAPVISLPQNRAAGAERTEAKRHELRDYYARRGFPVQGASADFTRDW